MAADLIYGLALLKTNMKAALSLRAAYAIRSLFSLLNHGLYLMIWPLIFSRIQSIGGWKMPHIMLAYGIGVMAWGLVSFFAYGLRTLPRQIEHGELDSYLTQPRPLLLNIALGTTQTSGAGEILFGLILMAVATFMTSIAIFWLLLIVFCAFLIFASMILAYASFGFWLRDYHSSAEELYYHAFIVSNRPEAVFHGWLKIAALTVMPVSFMTHIPLHFLIGHEIEALFYTLGGTAGTMLAAWTIFRLGLRRYESGNRFGVRG